jgi:hypothetical protein
MKPLPKNEYIVECETVVRLFSHLLPDRFIDALNEAVSENDTAKARTAINNCLHKLPAWYVCSRCT